LGVVPSLIMIAARRPLALRTPNQSLSYFSPGSVTPLRITFDNKSNLLSNFGVEQLYEISSRNGYSRGMDNFRGFATKSYTAQITAANVLAQLTNKTQGPVYCIKPAMDLSLDPRLSEGCTANINLQVTMDILNDFGANTVGELIIVVVNDGVISTVSGSTYVNSALMDSKDVVGVKSSQKGCTSNELSAYLKEDFSQSASDALASLKEGMGSKMGSGAASGGAKSGGGKGKMPDLDSLLF